MGSLDMGQNQKWNVKPVFKLKLKLKLVLLNWHQAPDELEVASDESDYEDDDDEEDGEEGEGKAAAKGGKIKVRNGRIIRITNSQSW